MPNKSEEQQEVKSNSTEEASLCEITTSSISSQLLNLPQEVFIEICENLHPKDLYSLSLVCKQIRTILWSNSATTQQLWCNSRMKFEPKYSYLKPPGDLSEQKFIWLLLLGKACQYCGENIQGDNRKLFWEFKVLICSKCSEERTISLEELNELNLPEKVLSCLPCISDTTFKHSFNHLINATSPGYYGTNPHYWKAEVFHAVDEYKSLSEDERESWVNKKQVELRSYIEAVDTIRGKENDNFIGSLIRYISHG